MTRLILLWTALGFANTALAVKPDISLCNALRAEEALSSLKAAYYAECKAYSVLSDATCRTSMHQALCESLVASKKYGTRSLGSACDGFGSGTHSHDHGSSTHKGSYELKWCKSLVLGECQSGLEKKDMIACKILFPPAPPTVERVTTTSELGRDAPEPVPTRPNRSALFGELRSRDRTVYTEDLEVSRESSETREQTYRRTFTSMSMGTEQELSGVSIYVASRKAIGRVTYDGEPVLEITSDMVATATYNIAKEDEPPDPQPTYTIELITFPAEKSDKAAWKARRDAFDWVVEMIDKRQLESGTNGKLKAEIKLAHVILGGTVSSGQTAKQATIGLSDDEISEDGLIGKSSWYTGDRDDELSDSDFADEASATKVYTYLASILEEMVRLDTKFGFLEDPARISIFDPRVKNAWGLLPRTPPARMLRALKVPLDGLVIKELLKSRDGVRWAAAYRYIFDDDGALSGHANISDSTVGGKPAMLFEYRSDSDIPDEVREEFPTTRYERDSKEIIKESRTSTQIERPSPTAMAIGCRNTSALWEDDSGKAKLTPKGMTYARATSNAAVVNICGRDLELSSGGSADWLQFLRR